MLNSIKLKNLSVFRITVFLVLNLLITNNLLFFLTLIYLLLFDYKELFLFVILYFLVFILNRYRYDYIPIGIVDYKVNDYYVINKFLYKTISYNRLNVGDVLFSISNNKLEKESFINNNILFISDDLKFILNLSIKNNLYNRIELLNNELRDLYKLYFYNIKSYDNSFTGLLNSLISYYLFKLLYKKNKKLSIISLLTYSLLFTFQTKFIFILLDYLMDRYNIKNKIQYKVLFILIINKYLIFNYSILITLLFDVYKHFSKYITIYGYIGLINIVFFNEINIFNLLLFRIKILSQIIIFITMILNIFINIFDSLIINSLSALKYLNINSFNVRGSINILIVIVILVLVIYKKKINILFVILLLLNPLNIPFITINYIDVGQGDSILISDRFNKGNVLIDTGSIYNYSKLKKYLFKKGIKNIDYLIITHDDSDHSGNIDNLSKDFKINNLIKEGTDINMNNINLKYLYIKDSSNDNDNSLVYSLYLNNLNFLFTGDISKNVEKDLLIKHPDLKCNVLKVSHHGSNTSSSRYFISRLMPDIAIISTNGMYNHPSNEVLDILSDYKVNTYITKYDKDIKIYLSKYLNIIKTNNSFSVIN